MKKSVAFFLLLVFVGGCLPFRPRISPYPSGLVFPLEKAGEIVYPGQVIGHVEKEGSFLYFATSQGFVFCLDGLKAKELRGKGYGAAHSILPLVAFNLQGLATSGGIKRPEVFWAFQAPGPLKSPPYLGRETVSVYDRENTLYCLDRQGRLRWKKASGEEITSPVREFEKNLYLGTGNGNFLALDTGTGERRWRFEAQAAIRSTPVAAGEEIIFGCDDHHLYFLDGKGNLVNRFDTGDKVGKSLSVEEDFLYFGSGEHFICFHLKRKRVEWKAKVGTTPDLPPVFYGERIFFLGSNNVLYCLNRKNGTILWWRAVPSRCFFQMEVIEKKIVVSSLSEWLVSFDLVTGDLVESFKADRELKSNPVWLDPYLLLNIYDDQKNQGHLQFMGKKVEALLSASKESPQMKSEEIAFNCQVTGFFHPRYEFYLNRFIPVKFGLNLFALVREEAKERVIQEKSEKNIWAWYPEEEGLYVVGVKVIDERQQTEARLPYLISSRENLRWGWWVKHLDSKRTSLFKNLKWKAFGPKEMAGKMAAVTVSARKPAVIYAGGASGGVWKSTDGGKTWQPIFEGQASLSIGDIAVAGSDPDILWVGTGESGGEDDSSAGTGVYKSEDGGKTWKNMGLRDSHHIGRVLIHPQNPGLVFVAALGHLSGPNEERGLFRTQDGGMTWQKVLSIDSSTGVADLVFDPIQANILYAASWERERKAWNFRPGGKGGGIYKSEDGGQTWKQLSKGLPTGEQMGRSGLAVAPSRTSVLYALVNNWTEVGEEILRSERASDIPLSKLEKISREDFLKLKPQDIQRLLAEYHVPPEVKAQAVMEKVVKEELTPQALAQALLEASRKGAVRRVAGAEVYRSEDRGETWKKMNQEALQLDPDSQEFFSRLLVDPSDENRIYLLGPLLLVSDDGGRKFKSLGDWPRGTRHQALWIDPASPGQLILGNDQGLTVSADRGENWLSVKNLPVGRCQGISLDGKKPYNIYFGLKDSGVYYGSSIQAGGSASDWTKILEGSAGLVQVDPLETDIIYAGDFAGNVFRINRKQGTSQNITPQAEFGEVLRFGHQVPFLISPHTPHVLYLGANRLFKSEDRGEHWKPLSPDLSSNPEQGNHPFGCLTEICESPLTPGLVYAGTDDGQVQVTRNSGASWERITQGLPSGRKVSGIEASQFEEGTVYVCLDGSAEDDFRNHLFRSGDYGKTWKWIAENLPSGPVIVVREDPKQREILYAGTDLGVYISLDRGLTWSVLGAGLDAQYMRDLAIHPETHDIVVASYGRGAYVLDGRVIPEALKAIQAKTPKLFEIQPVKLTGQAAAPRRRATIFCYLLSKAELTVAVKDRKGSAVKEVKATAGAGFNELALDLTVGRNDSESRLIEPGVYTVEITTEGLKLEGKLEVRKE